MYLIRSFFKRILDDLRQKKLIPLKILCFVHASTQLVLYPYLTIHMRELGISVEETAVMSSLTPLFLIIIPPLAGLFADKIGNFRLFLALTSSLGGLSALLLLLVPVGRYTVTYPPAVELIATCNGAVLHLQDVSQYSCHPLPPYAHESNMTLHSCGFICELNTDSSSINSVLSSTSYIVNLNSKKQSQRLIYRNAVKSNDVDSKDRKRVHILKNNPNFNSTMTQVSDNKIFFPTPLLYNMNCNSGSSNSTCLLGSFDIISDVEKDIIEDYHVRIHRVDDDIDETPMYWVDSIRIRNSSLEIGGVNSTNCIDTLKQTENDIEVVIHVGSEKFSKCYAACAMTTPRKSLCTNNEQHIDIDPAFTFLSYMALRMLISIIGGTSFALFEGAVIAIIREQRADYGMQKVYGSFGGMISSPLSGLFIDYASRGKGYTDFRPAFYMYAVLKVLSGILVLGLDLKFKKPAKTLVKDVITVIRNFEIVALLIVCVVMGIAWGHIESFLFWFLQDLGASQSLMGITITVGAVAGLPLLVLSGPIISRIGHSNVLFIGFIFYAIRLFGYSFIYNPWLSLIFEAMESVTSALSFTAAVTYAALLSSTTTDSSVQGLLGSLYYGVGKGTGSLIGGYLMKFFGTRPTYRLFAAATLITGCLYFIFNRFCIRKFVKSRENDISAKNAASNVESSEIPHTKVLSDDATDKKASEMAHLDHLNLVKDNTDGSSDSDVENPAYLDNEVCKDDSKKNQENA